MDREKEIIADHLPLEEIMVADIDGIEAPDNWYWVAEDNSPEVPPVVIEEDRGFSLVGNHRTVWHLKKSGKSMVKCLVVRGVVHVRPAHLLISNCTEEAMLFEGLLRREIVSNRSRLADMLGYSRARITQLLNQLKLPLYIRQKVLLTDDVSEFKLRPLLKLLDNDAKLKAGFKKLMDGKLSGRQMAIFANSDIFTEVAAVSSEESKDEAKEPAVTQVSSNGSIAELEGVFDEDAVRNPSDPGEPLAETDSTKLPVEKPPRIDMAAVLKELGNIRDSGWRLRAAEYSLPPQEIEFLEGVSSLRTGLYSDAIKVITEVISNDPDHHLAWFYLGRCLNLTGELQKSEEYLRNAVSRSSDNPDYLVELAIVLEKLKRHSEAEVFYRKSAIIRKKMAIGK